MDCLFYKGNRQALYEAIEGDALIVLFSGSAPRLSADAYYPFFANRNFTYLTGMSGPASQGFVLLAEKRRDQVAETLFILPPDAHLERWNGRRMKADEVRVQSGVEQIGFISEFQDQFHKAARTGLYTKLCLDIDKLKPGEPDNAAMLFWRGVHADHPFLTVENLLPKLRSLRTIKQPCEIEAMKQAMLITREAILNMMRASRPGMYEYEYKAVFDATLTRHGVLAPAFPPIISAGENNFCIHYDAYTGQARDGDMILNDVGACWDGLCNDVSRGWPCNGKFDERQRRLYTCAYNTSEHMFGIIKPNMPMADVDRLAREYCFEQLKGIGLCDRYEEVGRYMWHGGAHHVGFDVHDVVDMSRPVSEGMVFCVDIGIYCEEWGIGFRLEDNCLVTKDGAANLSADIPRSIEAIEAAMNG